jgi:hypothetical protein
MALAIPPCRWLSASLACVALAVALCMRVPALTGVAVKEGMSRQAGLGTCMHNNTQASLFTWHSERGEQSFKELLTCMTQHGLQNFCQKHTNLVMMPLFQHGRLTLRL